MEKWFPMMIEEPESSKLGAGITYYLFAFFVFPALITLMIMPTGHDDRYGPWLQIGYHAVNFVFVFGVFFSFLRDSFLTLKINAKEILKIAVFTAFAIVLLKFIMFEVGLRTQNQFFFNIANGTLLTSELHFLYFPDALLFLKPVCGTVLYVFLAPITVTCLLYVCVFAPVCGRRPVLAYVLVAVVTLIIHLLKVFYLWTWNEELTIYLLQLPVHLIACWSYQKTDTAWTPIIVLFLANSFYAICCLVINAFYL